MKSVASYLLLIVGLFGMGAVAQNPSTGHKPNLGLVRVVEVKEPAGLFGSPLTCDREGNLFVMAYSTNVEAVKKIDSNGKRVAVFSSVSQPDVEISLAGYFSVSVSGEVSQLVFGRNLDRYVFQFRSDGTLRSKIKLETGFPFLPSQIAAFPNGSFLVSGRKMHSGPGSDVPFTGIFKNNGVLIKELALTDDKNLAELATAHDRSVSSPMNASDNLAVSLGAVEIAGDGNAYLMRRLTNPVFYAISSTGEVVRRFEIEPIKSGYLPLTMHAGHSSIAVLFRDADNKKQLIRVLSLEGKTLADYVEVSADPGAALGPAFVCFVENPNRFTFLSTTTDHGLVLKFAEGQ
jgi:hypothetical protein